MEKGMAAYRADGNVEGVPEMGMSASGSGSTATASRPPLDTPRAPGGTPGGAGGSAANPLGPMIRPGVISLADGGNATLDDYPNWPSDGPAGELHGANGSRLVKNEYGSISYDDPDGNHFDFSKWVRPSDASYPDQLGPKMHDVWSSGEAGAEQWFDKPHPNDVARQLTDGESPTFTEPRTLDQLRAERGAH